MARQSTIRSKLGFVVALTCILWMAYVCNMKIRAAWAGSFSQAQYYTPIEYGDTRGTLVLSMSVRIHGDIVLHSEVDGHVQLDGEHGPYKVIEFVGNRAIAVQNSTGENEVLENVSIRQQPAPRPAVQWCTSGDSIRLRDHSNWGRLTIEDRWSGFGIVKWILVVIWSNILEIAIPPAILILVMIGADSWLKRSVPRTHQCPKCKYDLTGTGGRDTGCPECGWNRPGIEQQT